METVLSIDAGTQSVRAVLFDADGNIIDYEKHEFHPPYTSPEEGWAEFSAEDYWDALAKVCKALASRISEYDIVGCSLCTQRATVVATDDSGSPLYPAISWLDKRHSHNLPRMKGPWPLVFRALGLEETINYFRGEAESNWLAINEPATWAKTEKFLLLSGYLHYRLVDRFVDSIASQVGFIPFDYKKQRWSASHDWKWQAVNINASQLPELVPSGKVIGHISAQASSETGLPQGLPVIASGADKACEVLGSGCTGNNDGAVSFGTTATFNITSSKYLEPVKFIPPYPSVIDGNYNVEIIIRRGFWMVEWYRREFFSEGNIDYGQLEDYLASTPAGNQGLLLQPYWSPGIIKPGLEARGAMVGFTDVHGQASVYRAIIEGLMYALNDARHTIEQKSKRRLKQVKASGGGASSAAVLEIAADIFNLPVQTVHTSETSALGAAIITAGSTGLHPDIQTAMNKMIHRGNEYRPNPDNAKRYRKIYRKAYRPLYEQLKPVYKALHSLSD